MSSVPPRGDLYDWEQREVIGRVDEDVAFYRELIRPGASVLELACGTGRLARPLAEAGAAVVGIDVDPEMLAGASRVPGLRLVCADMERFYLHHRFDLVIAGYNALQLLPTPAARVACVRAVADHLAPAGVFAFEVRDFLAEVDVDVEPTLLGTMAVASTPVTLHGGVHIDRAERTVTYTREFTTGSIAWRDDVSLACLRADEVMATLAAAGLHGEPRPLGTASQGWVARRITPCAT